jgi:hypothetical protein
VTAGQVDRTEEPVGRRLLRGGAGGLLAGVVFAVATIVQGDPALAAGTASPTVGVLVRIRTSDARRDAAVHSPGRAPAQEGR